MLQRMRQEVDFFRKQADYSYKRTLPVDPSALESELQNKLNEANEHLGDQYRQV